MSDDPKPTEVEPKQAEVAPVEPTPKPRTYSEEEFKQVVAQRDEAKKFKREAEEAAAKEAEAKAIEDGKARDVLAENEALRKFKAGVEAKEATEREELLAKLTDDDQKKIGAAIGDSNALRAYVESTTIAPAPNQPKGGNADVKKEILAIRPGESLIDYNTRISRDFIGKSKH